jgi:uncharacterized protein YodC (DUF2158 family)
MKLAVAQPHPRLTPLIGVTKMNEIKPGNVVQLKSGGPRMTVSAVYRNSDGVPSAYCAWLDGKKAQQNSFPITSLKHAEE